MAELSSSEQQASSGQQASNGQLAVTPLHALHQRLGAKLVAFAGYDMPVQYPMGVLKEHLHTRENAGLFDVSHMGQAWLITEEADLGSDGAHEAIARAIETLVPGEILKLKPGGIRYSVLLNEAGGIVDDLMITRPQDPADAGKLFLIVNAACKDGDFALIEKSLAGRARLQRLDDRALIAVQGPKAAGVIDGFFPGAATQGFMTMTTGTFIGADHGSTTGATVYISRCGYTGEDGFELSVDAAHAEALAEALLAHDDVAPIGLGARDSLRLEAGLCLYGHDIDAATSPIDGNIAFAIGKRRRAEGGFPGADRILRELTEGTARRRVGLRPEGRAPAREGTQIVDADGKAIGVVTSGGFGPTLNGPLAMGYVDAGHAADGTSLFLMVRGKPVPAQVSAMPFVPQRYYRGA